MEDDILKELEDQVDILSTGNTTKSNKPKPKDNSMWSVTDIRPREIKPSELQKPSNEYTIALANNRVDLPVETEDLLIKLISLLNSKGYTLRYNFPSNLKITEKISRIDNLKVTSYLPWPKFNEHAPNVAVKRPDELAYRVACYMVKNFTTKPDAIRCLEAHYAQCVLGTELVKPVKFILAYSSCGTETITKDIKWETVRTVGSFIKYCSTYAIPIFNIGNKEALARLSEFIKTQEKDNNSSSS